MKRMLLLGFLFLTMGAAVTPVAEIDDSSRTITYQGEPGVSALETLKKIAEVETSQRSFGEFVTSINGLSAQDENSFWAFYVNGEMSRTGAGDYQAAAGDLIEWRLRARKNQQQGREGK